MKAEYPIRLNNDEHLICPLCGYDCTHQVAVDVFFRAGEDSKTGFFTRVAGLSCFIDTLMVNNPSRSRDGIKIKFECECGCKFDMIIIQHKGNTHMWLEEADE